MNLLNASGITERKVLIFIINIGINGICQSVFQKTRLSPDSFHEKGSRDIGFKI